MKLRKECKFYRIMADLCTIGKYAAGALLLIVVMAFDSSDTDIILLTFMVTASAAYAFSILEASFEDDYRELREMSRH